MNEELILLPSENQNQLALWKISSSEIKSSYNIFMTHGTFSDKRICMGIASYLIKKGYTCWIMEWRGHGNSSVPKEQYNFETIAKKDIPIAFEYLFNQLEIKELSFVGHSGGGSIFSMFLVNYPQYISAVKSMSVFGCQAFGAANSSFNYLKILFGKYVTALLGKTLATKNDRPHDESYYTMKQWFDWNLNKNFLGEKGMDYMIHLPKIKTPILSICGKGDTFVAPKSGCEDLLNAFQNPKNELLFCSKENGFKENYNHSRLILSRSAEVEIWPRVLEWIERFK